MNDEVQMLTKRQENPVKDENVAPGLTVPLTTITKVTTELLN